MPRPLAVPAPTPRDLTAVLFRERRLVLTTFAGTLLAVGLYALFAPSYQAHMKVLVRRGRLDPLMTPTPSQSGPIERTEVTEEELNSEVELLGDDEILRPVVQNSGLADDKTWLEQLLNEDDQERLAHAVRRVQRKLEVKAIHKSNLIAVTYSSSDPERAATVLRCLANAYLERHRRVRRPSGEFTFFEQQVEQARSGLLGAEVRLMDFNSERGVVAAALERDTILQKLTDTEGDEGQTRVAIHETVQRIRELETKLKSLPERTATLVRRSDNPQLMEKMKSKLLELELKRTELLTKFEPSYRLVQEVDQQIAETRTTLAKEDESPLRDETTDQDPNHAWAKAELVKAQVGLVTLEAHATANTALLGRYRVASQRLGNDAIKQEELQGDLRAAQERFRLYINKREEARIGDALDQGGILNVTLAEEPAVPALPARPVWMVGTLGLVLAGMLSTGLAFAADSLNPAFRTPDEVVMYLGTRVLASLPEKNG